MRFLFAILCLFSISFTNIKVNDNDFSNHIELFVHEDIINQFLYSFGEIKGNDNIGPFSYSWNVSNLRIDISPEKSEFKADVHLKSGNFNREDLVIGNVFIEYEKEENLILVKIQDVAIDIDVSDVINFIPKDAVLVNIDLSEYFVEPFKIEGPQPKSVSYKFDISDDSQKNIQINIKDSKLYLVDNGIKIFSNYECTSED